jgi:hypothetical protein
MTHSLVMLPAKCCSCGDLSAISYIYIVGVKPVLVSTERLALEISIDF